MSSPSRVPGSRASSTPRWRRMTAKARSPKVDSVVTSVDPRSGGPGICTPRASSPASNLDRAAGWRPQALRRSSTSGSSAPDPFGDDLHLHPPEPNRPLVVADRDGRVVQGHLGHLVAADAQGEGPTPGAHLQHLVERAPSGYGGDPPPHRTIGPHAATPPAGSASVTSRRWRRPPTPAGRESFKVASSLRPRRRGPQHEAGPPDPPVLGVEVAVHQPPGGLGQRASVTGGPDRPTAAVAGRPASARPAGGRGRRTATRPLCHCWPLAGACYRPCLEGYCGGLPSDLGV